MKKQKINIEPKKKKYEWNGHSLGAHIYGMNMYKDKHGNPIRCKDGQMFSTRSSVKDDIKCQQYYKEIHLETFNNNIQPWEI